MIVKEKDSYEGENKFEIAGIKAEEKMAWYLKRAFSKSKDIYIFNDLRLQFDVADYIQIDHLILHPHGFVFIERKSVSTEVRINHDGYWERLWDKQWDAMDSPLKQASVQADSFRQLIEEQTSSLREKVIFGLVQRKFDACPFDIIVAISNKGKISGNKPEETMKAENVCDYVKTKIKDYKQAWKKQYKDAPVYFRDNEPEAIRDYLLNSHCSKYMNNIAKEISTHTQTNQQKSETQENRKVKQEKITNATGTWYCKCGGEYDVRYANTAHYGKSYYRYCSDCKGREALESKCPKCQSDAQLKLVERITTYICSKNPEHHGIFHKNNKLWLKDKNKLASEK